MSESMRSSVAGGKRQAGFTLLELTVVVVIISTLFLFSYQYYLDLLVDVEKASVEQTVGVLRSAVGMKVAKMVVDGKGYDLLIFDKSNPMRFLAEVPTNYEGEVADPQKLDDSSGIWYFDQSSGLLIYKVKNTADFFSESEGLKQARFILSVVYDDDNKNNIAGLRLGPVERYSWFKKRY